MYGMAWWQVMLHGDVVGDVLHCGRCYGTCCTYPFTLSYTQVMWYMLHGERPLLGTVEKDFVSAAENHIALRPSLGDVTFLPFKALMEKCWEPDALGRLTAADAVCPQFACSSPPCVAC